jgi:hypothetical protein
MPFQVSEPLRLRSTIHCRSSAVTRWRSFSMIGRFIIGLVAVGPGAGGRVCEPGQELVGSVPIEPGAYRRLDLPLRLSRFLASRLIASSSLRRRRLLTRLRWCSAAVAVL